MGALGDPVVVRELTYDQLDVFGQQPGLGIYTQICLCYERTDQSSLSQITDKLTYGLERLAARFPWVACKVVNEGAQDGNTGTYKFRPLDKTPKLVVKDYTHDDSVPSWTDLKQANFPCRMLDESWVCPIKTLPGDLGNEARVLLLQATLVKGGLLLTINAAHNVMDMSGQGQIMKLLSKACHDKKFTAEELEMGNTDRRAIIPLLDDSWQPGSAFNHQQRPVQSNTVPPPESEHHTVPAPPPKCVWAFFAFSAESLRILKSSASETLTSGYVSTDDTISAFIWRSAVKARLPRLNTSANCTFARAIDPRRFMGISPTYPGFVQNMAYSSAQVGQLLKEPLGTTASSLRSKVDPKTSKLGYETSALATMLHRSPDKSFLSVTASLELSKDIALSSWVKEDCYGLDFNLGLGKPVAVRRPQFDTVEGLFYLMPKRPDGEIVAMLCLREEDMRRLKADEDFVKYGAFIG